MLALDKHLKQFWPDAELALFGSSANGFSFRQSDLDISLTFRQKSRFNDILSYFTNCQYFNSVGKVWILPRWWTRWRRRCEGWLG